MESERTELLVKIEAGEGANTAIQQLSQEKVTSRTESLDLSVSVSAFFSSFFEKMYAKYEIPVVMKHSKNSFIISHVSSEADPETFYIFSKLM